MALVTGTIIVGGIAIGAMTAGGFLADKVGEAAADTGQGTRDALVGAGAAALGTGIAVALILQSPGGRKLLGVP